MGGAQPLPRAASSLSGACASTRVSPHLLLVGVSPPSLRRRARACLRTSASLRNGPRWLLTTATPPPCATSGCTSNTASVRPPIPRTLRCPGVRLRAAALSAVGSAESHPRYVRSLQLAHHCRSLPDQTAAPVAALCVGASSEHCYQDQSAESLICVRCHPVQASQRTRSRPWHTFSGQRRQSTPEAL